MFGLHHEHGVCSKYELGMWVKIIYFGSLDVNIGNNLREVISSVYFLPVVNHLICNMLKCIFFSKQNLALRPIYIFKSQY